MKARIVFSVACGLVLAVSAVAITAAVGQPDAGAPIPYPDIVFDWLEMREKGGLIEEGPRRRVDVMVKDSNRFPTTGGWGFERFVGESKTERAATPPRGTCFSCHQKLAKDDLVLSTLRDRS